MRLRKPNKERTMLTRRNFTVTLAVLPLGLSRIGAASPQSYPTKPIRFVVPFPAGGSTDVGARLIAEHLSRIFGQQVYVENKSGANGTIGVEVAAKSAPDGYNILVTIDTVASNPHVFSTNVDPSKDLVPIIQVSRQPIVLAAHPSLNVPHRAICVGELSQSGANDSGDRSRCGAGLEFGDDWQPRRH
jgi:tripartite-type tricarboxylate transporter receptor subunit TctC